MKLLWCVCLYTEGNEVASAVWFFKICLIIQQILMNFSVIDSELRGMLICSIHCYYSRGQRIFKTSVRGRWYEINHSEYNYY